MPRGDVRAARRDRAAAARLIAAAGVVLLLAAGCSRTSDPPSVTAPAPSQTSLTATSSTRVSGPAGTAGARRPTTSGGPGRAAGAQGRGPRPLAATSVALELDRFPRPTDEACADNTDVIDVGAGDSIAEAIARARPGTLVRVAPGTYTESRGDSIALTWDTPDVCLVSAGEEQVVIVPAPQQKYGISIAGDDTVISGVTLRGFDAGIGLDPGEGNTQHRVTIERVVVEEPAGESRDGIVAYTDNRAAPGTPLTVDGLLLLDVVVRGTDVAISCNAGPCAHWWLEGVEVVGRRASESSGADAFAIEEGRQIVVANSVLSGASADGIDTKASDVVVWGSRVLDVARNGVKLWRGGDVINSVVDGTGADASLVGDQPGRYRYVHTLVTHHGVPGDEQYVGAWGYDVTAADTAGFDIEFVNCIFTENATGGLYFPVAAAVSFRNTIFGDAGADTKLVDLSGELLMATPEGLAALERGGRGRSNHLGDPAFADLGARTYVTRGASPARDAAERVAGLDVDLGGRLRAAGRGPDIGPVESG